MQNYRLMPISGSNSECAGVGAAFEAAADKVRFGRAASDGPAGCGAWPPARWRGCPGVLWHAARGALYGFGCGLPLTGRPALCRAKMGGHRPKAISGEHRPAVVLQRETSRYAAWWPNWLSAGLRSVSLGVAVCPRREAELQKRPGGWRTRSGGGRCG